MPTHSTILAWEIPWTEESDGLQSMGSRESDVTEQRSVMLLVKPKAAFWVHQFPTDFLLLLRDPVQDAMLHLVSRLFHFLWSLAAPVFPWLLWSGYFWRVLVRYFVQFSSICVWCFLMTDWDDTFVVKNPQLWYAFLSTVRPRFIVLPSTALCRYCVFYKLKVCGNLHQASLSEPFFSSISSRCVCVTFW